VLRYLTTVAALLTMSAYQAEVEKWRAEREAKLKADGGWLTVSGLFWLKDGPNRVEGAPGVFELHDGKALFRPDSGAVTEMKSDSSLAAGARTYILIERGGRYAIRLKDNNSKLRAEFRGLRWFPVREPYRVTARFVSYEKPKSIPIASVIGYTDQEPSPGYAEFTIGGQSLRLEPVLEDGELFFIFRDQTAAKETYPSGRFLYAALPRDGKVELDFNKAQNPPCAFTPYATCPLPPRQNILPVRIEAGEMAPIHSATEHRP
jgi:uncharacterized protein (DUF1684 family)